MDFKLIITIIAIILIFVGYIPYIKDTISGKTRPHIFSYFLWSIIVLVVFFLQIESGGGFGSWVTFSIWAIIFVIFILSFKNGKGDIQKADYIFLVLTIIAIIFWLIIKQPVISIVMLVIIDLLAFGPTIRKSWVDPYSETLSLYVVTAIRHGFTIFALSEINFITILFPLAWAIGNLIFAFMLLYRRSKFKVIINSSK